MTTAILDRFQRFLQTDAGRELASVVDHETEAERDDLTARLAELRDELGRVAAQYTSTVEKAEAKVVAAREKLAKAEQELLKARYAKHGAAHPLQKQIGSIERQLRDLPTPDALADFERDLATMKAETVAVQIKSEFKERFSHKTDRHEKICVATNLHSREARLRAIIEAEREARDVLPLLPVDEMELRIAEIREAIPAIRMEPVK